MEPGKIPHEIRHGELAQLGILPYQPYYGTHDATSLFVIVLSYLYHWTGDESVLRRYLPNAEAAIAWIDRYGDRDKDGFQEYKTRSTHGYYNQGWKDAGDAIVEADGTLAPLPIATCELQGYVYDAKLRMAEIYDVLGRPKDARRLRARGATPVRRFNETFWWEEEGTYYLGLNGRKQPIRSVASNAGHLLQSGIVPPERAGRVVRRLLRRRHVVGLGHPDAVVGPSVLQPVLVPHGLGLAARQRHRSPAGSGATASRPRRRRSPRAIFDAAERFSALRLPELFAGLPRIPRGLPGAVPRCERAAGVGGRLGVPVHRDPVRHPRDVRRRGVRSCTSTRPCPTGCPRSRSTTCAVGGGSLDIRFRTATVEVMSNTSGYEYCRSAPGLAPGAARSSRNPGAAPAADGSGGGEPGVR